jgi:drug/metabolite transporter (DMT)-like permease
METRGTSTRPATAEAALLDPGRTAQARRARLTGIALMCGAVGCFSFLDATAKYLGRHMDVLEVVWARYTFGFLLALVWSNPLTRPGMLRSARPVLQIGRSALLLGSTTLNFFAIKYLQLDQALTTTFATPFLVAALSGPVLGEWVGPRRWVAIGVGFLGVLVVTRPGLNAIHPAALLSAAGALCYALYALATRILARTDTNATTLFYSNLVGAVVMAPVVVPVWTAPDGLLIGSLMLATGALASLGHYLLIFAHRLAPASVLSPFMYSQIAWTVALGYAVFGDTPNRWTMAGAAIIIASGLYLLHRERVRGRARRRNAGRAADRIREA